MLPLCTYAACAWGPSWLSLLCADLHNWSDQRASKCASQSLFKVSPSYSRVPSVYGLCNIFMKISDHLVFPPTPLFFPRPFSALILTLMFRAVSAGGVGIFNNTELWNKAAWQTSSCVFFVLSPPTCLPSHMAAGLSARASPHSSSSWPCRRFPPATPCYLLSTLFLTIFEI